MLRIYKEMADFHSGHGGELTRRKSDDVCFYLIDL